MIRLVQVPWSVRDAWQIEDRQRPALAADLPTMPGDEIVPAPYVNPDLVTAVRTTVHDTRHYYDPGRTQRVWRVKAEAQTDAA